MKQITLNNTKFAIDIYNARLNATALNNNINFGLGIDDANAKNKYFIAGLFTQPTSGTYAIQLKPDSLMLNYQRWTVTSNNLITISPNNIVANNFVLQNGNQLRCKWIKLIINDRFTKMFKINERLAKLN